MFEMRRNRHSATQNSQRNIYRCFGCFHVRSGAMALGTWHLMMHLFAICALAYISTHLDEINQTVISDRSTLTIVTIKSRDSNNINAINTKSQMPASIANNSISSTNNDDDDTFQEEPIALPVQNVGASSSSSDKKDSGDDVIFDVKTSSDDDNSQDENGMLAVRKQPVTSYYWTSLVFAGGSNGTPLVSQRDLNLAFLLGCITVIIALMMLVGIVKQRPAYLVPFLTYQVMDLLVSCLTVAGFICYGPQLRDFVVNDADLQGLDSQWATLIIALVVLAVVFIKAYFVQIVWLCIRHLKEENVRRMREDSQPKVIYLDSASDPELSVFIFDDNGNIVKNSPPPPTYDNITEEQKIAPPAYSATVANA